LVSAQIIILTIAVIGFFATGGIGKIKKATVTAKQDFALAKEKTTDFVSQIKKTNKAKGGDIPTDLNKFNDPFRTRILNPQGVEEIKF